MKPILHNVFDERFMIPSALLVTGQTTLYLTGDDGDLEKGIDRQYTVLTIGQHSGTTNITINGKTIALSNNAVIDEKTGLMWARYVPQSDIGPATDGSLFWKQWTLAAESCTFATAGDTITAAAGTPFDTGALCIGRKITISGTVNNNGVVTVSAIATDVVTVSENLTDEGPVDTTFATLDDLIWDFVDQANANSLGGYADWRIPNYLELLSLLNIGVGSPTINVTAFPSTPISYSWTSSKKPGSATSAQVVGFNVANVSSYVKTIAKNHVRLVRG